MTDKLFYAFRLSALNRMPPTARKHHCYLLQVVSASQLSLLTAPVQSGFGKQHNKPAGFSEKKAGLSSLKSLAQSCLCKSLFHIIFVMSYCSNNTPSPIQLLQLYSRCFADRTTALHVQFFTMQPTSDVSFPQETKRLNTRKLLYILLTHCHLNHDHLHGLHAHALSSQSKATRTEAHARHLARVKITEEILLTWQENKHT